GMPNCEARYPAARASPTGTSTFLVSLRNTVAIVSRGAGYRNLGERIEEFMQKPVRKAVFPVAGLGTRILPATKAMPKEMLPVVDKPLIQYAIEEAKAAGIEQFYFVTGRAKNA